MFSFKHLKFSYIIINKYRKMHQQTQPTKQPERRPESQLENKHDETTLPPHKVFVGSEVDELEKIHEDKIKLPPIPCGVLPWTEEEKKILEYSLDKNDKFLRVKFKLFNIWNIWGAFRNNEKLIEIINVVPDDHKSDEFFLREAIVSLIDSVGKALNGGTDIMTEFS